MTACAIFESSAIGFCAWCREPAEEHAFFWCSRCRGDGFLPDPLDRASHRRGLPTWAWRQYPCECTLDEEGRYVRRGGVVDRHGIPVSQERIRHGGAML